MAPVESIATPAGEFTQTLGAPSYSGSPVPAMVVTEPVVGKTSRS